MEEKKEKRGRKFSKEDIQVYFISMGIFFGIALIAMLIMLKQFRHLWVECVNEPITAYSVVGTDWTWRDIETEDRRGNVHKDTEDTYYLKMKFNDGIYMVEVSEDAYDRARDKNVTDFAAGKDVPSFYYDKLVDEVFQGWFHPDVFYAFFVAFFVLFGFLFIYMPFFSGSSLLEREHGADDADY